MSAPAAWIGFVAARDQRIMRRVNGWSAPRWIRLWMICATRGGDGWLWYAMLGVVWLFGGEAGPRAITSCVSAVAIGIAVFLALKRTIRRRRPCQMEPHVWCTLAPPDQFSFPSGHTITAFSVAVPLSGYYPDAAIGLYFVASSIAVSRVLLGMHFVSDVLAGAAIGSLLGCSCAALLS